MNDATTTLQEIKACVADFVARREWQKYHRPKDLSMALSVEAAELMEHFQWVTHQEADAKLADPQARDEVSDEMADILAFLLSLAHVLKIDLSAAFERKMAKNERKYPADQVRGDYRKPRQRG